MDEKWLGLIGVGVGAVVVGGKELYFDWKRQHSNAKYMAIRAVCLLDRYMYGCADVVQDDGTVQGQPANQDGTHSAQADYPPFPIESLDGDWKSMPQKLMFDLLSFSSRIESALGKIAGQAEHAFPPEYEEEFEERQFQFAKLGLKANDIADQLRKKHGISERPKDEWNPLESFQRRLDEITKAREERAERYRLAPNL